MKEQWKKHDSDAKLLQNVEEGRPQPIKIELPISAFALKQDGCCNRLITFLRVAVLFVLLLILSWTAVTLYSNYYPRQLVTDEKAEQLEDNQRYYDSEENKTSFRNKVYAMMNEQDHTSNEIDSFAATTTSASIASSKTSVDSGSDEEKIRFLTEMLKMKQLGTIRVIDLALIQENNVKNELQNVDESFEKKLNDYIFKERFNLENVPEVKSVNEDVDPMTDQQAYINLANSPPKMPEETYDHFTPNVNMEPELKSVISAIEEQAYIKLSNFPDKELDSDKEDSTEELKNKYESVGENGDNEVIVIPSLEDENINQADQDLENYMEVVEVDDLEELINDIANVMGLLEEPSSEVNQSNEEPVAVIQEEIKNNEEKLEVADLVKVSSAEENSKEESVAIVQEEIKDDDEIVPTTHFLHLEPISEEDDPNTEAVAVIQEEIKNDSSEPLKPEILEIESNYKVLPNAMEENSPDKSQEKTNLEDTIPDDIDANINQDVSSEKLREILSAGKTMSSLHPDDRLELLQKYAHVFAVVLEPFVGNDYNLVHWFYSISGDPANLEQNDKKKFYAARILYNPNINEYDEDIAMWLDELSDDSFFIELIDLMNSQTQIQEDTFLQNQILEKLLSKLSVKSQFDLNYISFLEACERIERQNSYHIKSWFLATHPSIHEREQISNIVAAMDFRRTILYPVIKYDASAIEMELVREDNELEGLKLKLDEDDFNQEPVPTMLERKHMFSEKDIKSLFDLEKVESISAESKVTSDYLVDENKLTDREYQLQQAIMEMTAQLEQLSKKFDDSEEPVSEYQNVIEAMKKVGEEYEQTEKSAEETTNLLIKNHDEIEESVEETAASAIDDESGSFKEVILPNSDQFESWNADLNPVEEIKAVDNEQTFLKVPAEDSEEEINEEEEAFLKWLEQYTKNIQPEENADLPLYDPYDY